MSVGPDDPWAVAIGSAISDGTAIDWTEMERLADSADRQRLVRQFRRIAAVAAVHKSQTDDLDEFVPAEEPPARQWRHLTLFERLGAGAFGTVYRGRDTQVERDVAVKLLPAGRGASGSPLAEARHLARIRHSNVVVVYGADRDDQYVGIWMEYIDGQTLAAMVRERGPMSAREVAGIGIDLCRALSALHGAGLLHRDIKAQNVMREVGGRIVLMDFGGVQARVAPSATAVISGTPLYMAPELFEGGAATTVTDIYSLGALLFFLLTARLPVEAATIPELRDAHRAGRRNQLRDMRSDVSEAVVQVIERATAPEPAARYQTAGELEHALANASGLHPDLGASLGRAPVAAWWLPTLSMRDVRFWVAAALLIAAVASVRALSRSPRPTAAPPMARFTIGSPLMTGSWPRVSPDGRHVVFGTSIDGGTRFWLRSLDSLEGRALPTTSATETPFWSPDSRALCYFEGGKLKRIALDRGEPEVLADAPGPRGGDWSEQAIIYATQAGIYRLSRDGGAQSQLTSLDESRGEYQHGWPEFLPDGRRFLYIIRSTKLEETGLYVSSIDGASRRRIMPAHSRVAYAHGHVLFVRDGILFAQPFDEDTASPYGEAVALATRVHYHGTSDAAFDVSANGVLVYGRQYGPPSTRLVLFDRRGREVAPLTPVGSFRKPRFSPDGQRVVAEQLDADGQNSDLWLYGVWRESSTRLTSDRALDVNPVWSPDGTRIAFSSRRDALYDIFEKTVDSTEPERPLLVSPTDKFVESWSPDGRYVTAAVQRSGLWIIPLAVGEKPWRARIDEQTRTWQSEFSPDGRWLAYMSEESGRPEVYVEPFPATEARWQISARGGAEPHWRADGRELFFLAADGTLQALSVPQRGWHDAASQTLFRVGVPELAGSSDYSVAPDGGHLVVNTFVANPTVPPIEVVVSWTTLLQGAGDARN